MRCPAVRLWNKLLSLLSWKSTCLQSAPAPCPHALSSTLVVSVVSSLVHRLEDSVPPLSDSYAAAPFHSVYLDCIWNKSIPLFPFAPCCCFVLMAPRQHIRNTDQTYRLCWKYVPRNISLHRSDWESGYENLTHHPPQPFCARIRI